MRFGFVTCVQLGLACMEEIYEIGGALDLAITLPANRAADKSGRVYISGFCAERDVPLLEVDNINDQRAVRAIGKARLDWLFIIGWSQIAGQAILDAPVRGCLGIHPTLLPVGRGRASIPWTIMNGDEKTGVTLFRLVEDVDAGPILSQEIIEVSEREDAGSLYGKIVRAHRKLIRLALPQLQKDSTRFIPQDESKATYWERRTPADGEIYTTMTVEEVDRLVRACTRPYPGAFLEVPGRRVRIWQGCPTSRLEREVEDSLILEFSNGRYTATQYSFV